MTYNVLMGTLNPTHSHSLTHSVLYLFTFLCGVLDVCIWCVNVMN